MNVPVPLLGKPRRIVAMAEGRDKETHRYHTSYRLSILATPATSKKDNLTAWDMSVSGRLRFPKSTTIWTLPLRLSKHALRE